VNIPVPLHIAKRDGVGCLQPENGSSGASNRGVESRRKRFELRYESDRLRFVSEEIKLPRKALIALSV
jgi:hypothetical protein